MIEVETAAGRIAYGPVGAGDVPALSRPGCCTAARATLRLGRPEDIPFLARQTRLIFARCGIVDPLSLEDYRAHGGFAGLEQALAVGSASIIDEVSESGLRGRGGAGFPAGVKWKTVAEANGDRKYIVCNADEGDSGTFADRMLMEGDPFVLIEGMMIAGIAVGATKGYVYIRSEYPDAVAICGRRSSSAAAGYLGASVAGSAHDFDIDHARRGRGLCLRRGNRAAGKPRGQARPSARQAAAAGA